MDAKALIVGFVLMGMAGLMAINIRKQADSIVRYYNSIPSGRWGPAWLRWQWRPSERQALVAAWFFVLLGLVAGLVAVITGLKS